MTRPYCPFGRHECVSSCMLFLTSVDSDIVNGNRLQGAGACSIAVHASHVASEQHVGGNYLMPLVDYKIVIDGGAS